MSLPLTCHPTTPFSEAKSTELGLKAGRSLRLALGSWGRGTQRAKKRKKQPLLHLLAQKRKPATALKASESSAAERMFLSLPLTREDLGPCVSPRQGPGQFWITAAKMSPGGAGRQGKHLRGRPGCVDSRDDTWGATPKEPSWLRRGAGERKRVCLSRGHVGGHMYNR